MPRILLFICLCLTFTASSAGQRYALLVGVEKVAQAQPSPKLPGTGYDLKIMQDIANWWSVPKENTTVMGKQSPPDLAPRHANFKRELERLWQTTRAGDALLLYFSGHGVQQPSQKPGNETDGLDEVFLFEDSQRWNTNEARLPGTLVDDEMGGWLQRFNNKGVFVWLVVDTCHAGTFTRSQLNFAETEEFNIAAAKFLKPGWMGVDSPSIPAVTSAPKTGKTLPFLAAFYAVEQQNQAYEISLKKQNGQRVGLFTHQLQKTIAALPAGSKPDLAELAKLIQQQYAPLPTAIPRPSFELGQPLQTP